MNIGGLWDQLVDAVCRPPRDDGYAEADLVGGRRASFRFAGVPHACHLKESTTLCALMCALWAVILFFLGYRDRACAGCLSRRAPGPDSAAARLAGCNLLFPASVQAVRPALLSPGCDPGEKAVGRASLLVRDAATRSCTLGCLSLSGTCLALCCVQENNRGQKLQCSHYRPCVVTSSDGRLPCVIYCHCEPAAALPCKCFQTQTSNCRLLSI